MIEIKNLSKKYKDFYALKDINLTLPSKGLIGISGASGSGKTTLLNAVALMENNYEGEILINNSNIFKYSKKEKDNYHKNIGYIFQNPYLFEFCNVKDNLKLLSMIKGKNREIDDILKIVKLDKVKNKKVYKLSGGQRQRVSIASSLISKPKILLCDEPTGSLDNENSENIMSILKKISKDILVIVVSHNLMLTKKYADSIIYLKNGEVTSYENQINVNEMVELNNKSSFYSKIKFLFYFAFKNIFQHKKRTIFTSILISIGLIGLILAFLLKDGFTSFFASSLGSYESNKYMYCYSKINQENIEVDLSTFEDDFENYNKGYFYQYDFKDKRNKILIENNDLYLKFNNLGYIFKDEYTYSKKEIGICCSDKYIEYLCYIFNENSVDSINKKLKEKEINISFEYLDNQMNLNFNLRLINIKESKTEYTYFIHSSPIFLKEYFKDYITYNFEDNNKIRIIPYIESNELDKSDLLLNENKKKYDYLFDNKIYNKEFDYVFKSNYYRMDIDLVNKISEDINSKYIYSMAKGIDTMGYFDENIKIGSIDREIGGKEVNFISDEYKYNSMFEISISKGLFEVLNSYKINIKINEKLREFSVVSIIDNDSLTIYQNSYWSYSLFKDLFNYEDHECIALSVAFSNNDDKIISLLNNKHDNLEFICPLEEITKEINNIVDKIKLVILFLSSFCMVISLFLMAIIIFINTIEQQKLIFFLRINGIRKIDILFIYLIESILIGFFSYFIAIYFSFILSIELNFIFNILLENKKIINLLSLKKDTILNVFYLIISMSILSGIIPALITANKSKIDILKN